jgi:nitroimidazol reductase NimA-like FMN-containing flavoprotein (pyridoxamine 5'-phosphate oxidase superfamily)
MPSRREAIEMTPDEVRDYLKQQKRIILVTNGANGLPHPMPMNFGVDEQGRIVMTTFAKAQKVKNVERDPRASLLVESGEGYADLKSVLMYCDVEILTGAEVVAEAMGLIQGSTSLSKDFSTEMSEQARASYAKRSVLRFTPFQTISWDHTKLGGRY